MEGISREEQEWLRQRELREQGLSDPKRAKRGEIIVAVLFLAFWLGFFLFIV